MFLFAELEHSNWVASLLQPQSNLINWLILVALLVWLAGKYLPPIFQVRKAAIESELIAARRAKENAAKALEDQKQKVAAADREVDGILAEAKQIAEQMRLEMDKQTDKDVVEVLKKFDLALANERQMAISETRAIVIRAAIKLAEASLRSAMTEQARDKLLTQFVEQLDNLSEGPQLMPPGQFGVRIQ
jgi:F-type H+-transporting ATPase subunit b